MKSTIMHYTPAYQVTAKAKEALTQGTFVQIAGEPDGRNPLVKPAGADVTPFGVVAHIAESPASWVGKRDSTTMGRCGRSRETYDTW